MKTDLRVKLDMMGDYTEGGVVDIIIKQNAINKYERMNMVEEHIVGLKAEIKRLRSSLSDIHEIANKLDHECGCRDSIIDISYGFNDA